MLSDQFERESPFSCAIKGRVASSSWTGAFRRTCCVRYWIECVGRPLLLAHISGPL